jgi:hypothetical protein
VNNSLGGSLGAGGVNMFVYPNPSREVEVVYNFPLVVVFQRRSLKVP